jgi:N-acetylmuramoyl-L-alanine amidase
MQSRFLPCSTLVFSLFLSAVPALVSAAGGSPKPNDICNRDCWNARSPSSSISEMSNLNRAIVHHTASSSHFQTAGLNESKANVRGVQNYHMDGNGWSDIGYHYLVDKHGNIFVGRLRSHQKEEGSKPRGAHDGDNTNSFGFTLLGYFHPPYNQVPTQKMKDQLAAVIAWRMPGGWNPYGSPGGGYGELGNNVGRVDMHRNVKATACPGDEAASIITNNLQGGWLRNEIDRIMNP